MWQLVLSFVSVNSRVMDPDECGLLNVPCNALWFPMNDG